MQLSLDQVRMSGVKYVEIAELCHTLNSLTKRQFRPGHQLVKLYNCLIKFSTISKTYEGAGQLLTLFEAFGLEPKQTHPNVVAELARFCNLGEAQKEALLCLANQLDNHERWEWESRKKAKTRRKTYHNKKSAKKAEKRNLQKNVSKMPRPTSTCTLSSMESNSSECTSPVFLTSRVETKKIESRPELCDFTLEPKMAWNPAPDTRCHPENYWECVSKHEGLKHPLFSFYRNHRQESTRHSYENYYDTYENYYDLEMSHPYTSRDFYEEEYYFKRYFNPEEHLRSY